MSMTKVRLLRTTTVAGRRRAKGEEVNVDEKTIRDLVATGKAKIVKESEPAKEQLASGNSRRKP